MSDIQATAEKVPGPLPDITAVTKPFWDAAERHEFIIQRCPNCQRYQHEPIVLCPACATPLEWTEASGEGELYSFIIVHNALHPSFVGRTPYNVAVVKLDEGPFITTRVVGSPNSELAIGRRVRVAYEDREGEATLPVFELV